MTWYNITSGGAGITVPAFAWTSKLNFLNPRDQSLARMWGTSLSSGDSFAIVGWPVFMDIRNTIELLGRSAAKYLLSLSTLTLRNLLAYETEFMGSTEVKILVSMEVCQTLCTAATRPKNIALAKVFLTNYFPYLKEKHVLAPSLSALLKGFTWSDIGLIVETAIRFESNQACAKLLLSIMHPMDYSSPVHSGITRMAMERTQRWVSGHPNECPSTEDLCILLTHVIATQDPDLLLDMGNLFRLINATFLDRVVSAIGKCLQTGSSPALHRLLFTVVARRREWLAVQIQEMDKPFAWEIPVADFPDAAAIATFLRSPMRALDIRGLISITEARTRVQLLQAKIKAALRIRALGSGVNAYVNVAKLGETLSPQAAQLLEVYRAEMERLTALAKVGENANLVKTTPVKGTKRPREP